MSGVPEIRAAHAALMAAIAEHQRAAAAGEGRRLLKRLSAGVLDAERRLADLGSGVSLSPLGVVSAREAEVARALEHAGRRPGPGARGERPLIAIHGRVTSGAAEAAAYGGVTRGVALDGIRRLTPAQRRTGSVYAAMVERATGARAAGISAIRVDVSRSASASAPLAGLEALEMVRIAEEAALGAGYLGDIRAVQKRGLRVISRLALLRGVCVAGASLASVLKAYGWSAHSRNVSIAGEALCGALDAISASWGEREARHGGALDSRIEAL